VSNARHVLPEFLVQVRGNARQRLLLARCRRGFVPFRAVSLCSTSSRVTRRCERAPGTPLYSRDPCPSSPLP
jgi:hypothetical protein